MTEVIPLFGPVVIFLFLTSFMVTWDGLVRRHVRFTFRILSTDFHLRGIPAVAVGLVGLAVLLLTCRFAVQQLSVLSQTCGSDVGCVADLTLLTFNADWWMLIFILGVLAYFSLWMLSIRDAQGPYLVLPLAPGVVFNEGEIVRRAQARLASEGLPSVQSDTIVRAASEIRWTGAPLGLYKTRNLGVTSPEFRTELLHAFAQRHIDALSALSSRQQRIIIGEVIDYVREVRIRGINAYPWNRTSETG
jgi:hypothetical protein